MTTDYALLADLKTRMRITGAADDTELSKKITIASRRIDEDCGRRFYLDASASARTYTVTNERKLLVDDFATTTGLIVETGYGSAFSTVASTSYRVAPDNAITKGRAAWVLEARAGVYCWPVGYGQDVRVTATWGWPSVPDNIAEACLFMAQRLFKRKDSPEGIAGSTDFGLLRVIARDPDYLGLIDGYVRPEV